MQLYAEKDERSQINYNRGEVIKIAEVFYKKIV